MPLVNESGLKNQNLNDKELFFLFQIRFKLQTILWLREGRPGVNVKKLFLAQFTPPSVIS